MAEWPEYLTIAQACVRVGVKRRTIYHWIATGKVQYRRTAGGSVRILAASLWRPAETGEKAP